MLDSTGRCSTLDCKNSYSRSLGGLEDVPQRRGRLPPLYRNLPPNPIAHRSLYECPKHHGTKAAPRKLKNSNVSTVSSVEEGKNHQTNQLAQLRPSREKSRAKIFRDSTTAPKTAERPSVVRIIASAHTTAKPNRRVLSSIKSC